MTITVVQDSDYTILGTSKLTYKYDANLESHSEEYHTLGGRWYLDGVVTRTDWETAPPTQSTTTLATTSGDTIAPRIGTISTSSRVYSRVATIRIHATDNVGVTKVRFANGSRAFGPWRTYASIMRQRLTSGLGLKTIRVQARDAAGHVSATRTIRTRRVR